MSSSGDDNQTFPMKCSALRKGGMLMIQNRPCKVVEMNTSKPGKHGHAKVHIVALDIFTAKKIEHISPATHNIMVPECSRKEYILVGISDDNYVTLMDDTSYELRKDLKVPGGKIGEEILKSVEGDRNTKCTVISACGQEGVVSVKGYTPRASNF